MHSSLRPDQNIARSTSRAKCWLSILFLFQHTSNAKLCWSHFHDNIVTHGPVFASVESKWKVFHHVLLYERIKIGEYPILRFVRFLRSLITSKAQTTTIPSTIFPVLMVLLCNACGTARLLQNFSVGQDRVLHYSPSAVMSALNGLEVLHLNGYQRWGQEATTASSSESVLYRYAHARAYILW